MSLITQWRTFDFYFENKHDAANFHVAVESMIVCKVMTSGNTKSIMSSAFRYLEVHEKNVKAPQMVLFRMLKERLKLLAQKKGQKMADFFFKALLESIKALPKANQEEREKFRHHVQAKLERRLVQDDRANWPLFKRVHYPGTSAKLFHRMSEREFDDYMNHIKRDVTKAFNIGKKFYIKKFGPEDAEVRRLFELKCQQYLQKKFRTVDQKKNQVASVQAYQSLQDYYERFCNRRDNPTMNLIEVDAKKDLHQALMRLDSNGLSIQNQSLQPSSIASNVV